MNHMIRLAHRRRLSSLKKVVSADLTKLVYFVGDPGANFETYRLPGHGQKDESLTLQTAKFSDVKFEESRERLSSTRWQFIGSNILAGAGGYLIYYALNLPLIDFYFGTVLFGSLCCFKNSFTLSNSTMKATIRSFNKVDHAKMPICHHIAFEPESKKILLGLENNPFAMGPFSVYNIFKDVTIDWYEMNPNDLFKWQVLQEIPFYAGSVYSKPESFLNKNSKSLYLQQKKNISNETSSIEEYLSRRHAALNRSYIFLKNFETKEIIRIHVKIPKRQISSQNSFLKEIIYELEAGSRTYGSSNTKELTEFFFYPGLSKENQKIFRDCFNPRIKAT